jgi:hypothetical protein
VQYDLTWKEKVNKEHTFSPISITYNTTSDFSPKYQALVNQVPILAQSNLPEVIMGSFYNYTFNSVNPKAENIFTSKETSMQLVISLDFLTKHPGLTVKEYLTPIFHSM